MAATTRSAEASTWKQTLPILFLITFSAGVTPIVIRVTQGQGVPSLAIVFMRLALTVVTMAPYVFRQYRDDLERMSRADWLWGAAAGFWLALNLTALFFSLEYASVFITGIIRRLTPIWVIVPEIVLLGAVFSWRMWTGSVLAVVGVVVVTLGTGGGVSVGTRPLLGVMIAVVGSVCFGMYLLIGRRSSNRIPSLLYSWVVFVFAGVVALVIVLMTRTPLLGYEPVAYLWVGAVTLLAQYVGHLSINMGLKFFSATAMSILLQLSVVLSGVIAFFQFGEVPGTLQLVGSAVLIVGVVLASTEKNGEG